MIANRGSLIGICLLLLFCQLPKSDAKRKKQASATWSEWKEGECSRSCGGGVRTASRTCMNNRSDGRFHCKGESTRYTLCNTQECPDKLDFRAFQCSKYNDEQKKWKPVYGDGADACALICALNRTHHTKLSDKVVDGTRCRHDAYDVCINGKCEKAGCDQILGSTKQEDACRQCGGEGKNCKTVKGYYENEEYEGYKDIITILKGANNIHIHESRDTQNFFAVRNFFGRFYLNSKWKLAPHKKFVAAGTVFRYQKDSTGQVLMARGPTTEALTLVLVGKGDSAKVHYEYYIPEVGHTSKPLDRKRMRRPKNKHVPKETGSPRHGQEHPKSRASLIKTRADRPSKDKKLISRRRTARDNVHPSADTPQPSGDAPPSWDPRRAAPNYQWQHGSWSECSGVCGEEGVQRRAVQCYDMSNRVAAKGMCNEEGRPANVQKCEKACDGSFRWTEAGWTECSKSCGGGEMSSIAICEEISKSGRKPVEDKHCVSHVGASPQEMKVCNEQPCADSPVPTESPCWETLYGCCPDRRTAASGPDNAGCEERRAGCQHTDYGCCPDGATPARGPDYYGCRVNCRETDYGCCPDGATPAQGPNYYGCRVDCQESEYGCCPDGSTPARGPRYAGCPSVEIRRNEQPAPTADTRTKDKRVCQMPEDTGSCGDYAIKWAYNATSGRCSQFWYGGCGGNDNRFEDERACTIACRGERSERTHPRPTAVSPTRKEVPSTVASETRPRPTSGNLCELEEDAGTCGDYEIRWAYNATSGRCQQFWYGGCGGNDNRFDSDRDCQVKCRRGTVSGCTSTPFGCCEDGVTAARGPQRLGCPESGCKSSRYGCCPDGVTASRGLEHEGCSSRDCNVARYGCCQDGSSFARGDNYEGCRQLRCDESSYGCCPDGVTFARGENYAGCRVVNECERTEHGCCPDKKTTAQGPNGEGCCHYTEFGCCPDGLSISGPNHESCRTRDCRRSRYGCCRDGVNFARGEDFRGCPSTDCRNSAGGCCPDGVTFVSEGCAPPDCHATSYGCCPDGQTIARGHFHEGCKEKDCRESRYGCCPDGASYAKGEDYGGCPTCRETKYGCCPDGITVARGDNYHGCTQGSCHSSDYGCCPDMRTAALGPEHLGCKDRNCQQYRYGCCEDGVTYARGKNMDGCPKVEGCASSRYGCCEDRRTAAQGPDRYGCPETHCEHSEYGCCEDGVTFARGRDMEGCHRRIGGCAGTRYGCCEDRRTAAQGPDRYGCPETHCEHSEYGCCEDGVTFARGRDMEGCHRRIGGCAGTRYGCCEDRRTAAQGPDRYGCPETHCEHSEYGCCEDGVTFARGRDMEGCPRRLEGCERTRYGCCEDRRTEAQGPDRYGCPETHCEHSEYGCCEDGVTFARGRDKEGCPRRIGGCAGTRYGCCEDRRTAAQGPDRYGCPETHCEHSEYGCCEDGVTFARGRDMEGCPRRIGGCAGTRYGCCEDRSTAAQGPDRYGCPETRCDLSEHGCCPDGTTPARGPDHEGCRRSDCNRSRYGCCPDGVSFARGENSAGCQIDLGCEASAYGCCPDRVTAARGPEYAGCPPGGCSATRYGCCPDEVTSADGPNYAGCEVVRRDCSSTRYGCCPDRVTVARGPDYAGCVVPTPTASSEVDCESDSDTGSCFEYVTRWFFNRTDSRCQQFWYGGCGGNNNRFETERECDRKCRRRRGSLTTAAPIDPCRLPYEEGSCSSSSSSNEVRRWYYEESTHSCQMFWYSGCDGNGNNFESESSCVQRCFHPTVPVTVSPTEPSISREPRLEACSLEKDESICPDGIQRTQISWYYDLTLAACQQFNYSGCGGNDNRFDSAEKCTRTCNPRDVCQMPSESGVCLAYSEFWYFNKDSKKCEPFVYGGCGGNANRFATKSTCKKTCGALLAGNIGKPTVEPEIPPQQKTKDSCVLRQKPGTCDSPVGENVWFYNMTEGICQLFNGRVCSYNDNKFSSRQECESVCDPRELCALPQDSGTCYAYSEQYYFNPTTKKCERFVYGGCGGNANRFPSIGYCEKSCNALMERNITTGPERLPDGLKIAIIMCHLQPEKGPCRSNKPMWYYEVKEARCRQFTYGGCQGNQNRFTTREGCENTCSPQVICSFSRDAGNCTAYHRGYYFNSAIGRCEHISYGDCYGNANRFYSAKLCQQTCTGTIRPTEVTTPYRPTIITTLRPERPRKPTVEDCHLEKDSGSCRAKISAWHYDSLDNTCKQFYYGGCEGNANRFQTRRECEQTCNAHDICNLPKETGLCLAYSDQFHYNRHTRRCEQFVYGGCGGNANRFSTLAKCHIVCRDLIEKPTTTKPIDIPPKDLRPVAFCHLEKKVGSCQSQIPSWHYDTEERTCKPFYYGGCKGNENRFASVEQCESICNPYDICNLPKEAGICYAYSEQFYFNPQTKRCEEFVYGGCGGNANRFVSLAKCQASCHSLIEEPTTPSTSFTSPEEVCHLPKKVGSCRAQLPAWHYDAVDHECKLFYYGGCDGNANRFQSKEECQQLCRAEGICQLPKKSGKCYAYSEQYYFDSSTNRCEQFVYGGCGGNANRFVSAAKCMDVCKSLMRPDIARTTTKPTVNPGEACHLEKKVGPCRAQLPAWHYDSVEHKCKPFGYGGCQGNANNFQTSYECHQTCNSQSICNLPKESGKCYAYSEQYYFNSRTRRCEQFVYGGCDGNANRFATIDECMNVCRSLVQPDIARTTPTPTVNPAEACHLEKKVGPCRAALPAWHYDTVDHQCKPFYFGGCEGNANNFKSSYECHETCKPQRICNLPKESGKCYAYSEQYYFNSRTRRCEQFVYGGCDGNANRFATIDECMNVCKSSMRPDIARTTPTPTVNPAEACHLEKKVGPCRAALPAWHYDTVDHQCKPFYFGGCEGNANNFKSSYECHETCKPQRICNLPKESGKCYAYSEQYYFNSRTRRCEQFVYGGCDGNANRFATIDDCMDVCRSLVQPDIARTTPTLTVNPAEACHLEKKVGPYRAALRSWHYDPTDHHCKPFYFGCCEGNANNFKSSYECHETCKPQRICNLPKESGKCYAYSEQYYFNSRTKRCEQFVYGGCDGNANRFATIDECMNVCKSSMRPDIARTTHTPTVNPGVACHLKRKVGPCRAALPAWHYDTVDHQCKPFYFGGCEDNANNFKSSYECHETCKPQRICNLPKESGNCYAYSEQYYFNSRIKRCEKFVYGGCDGNANRFATIDECTNACKSSMQPEIPKTTPPPHVNPEVCKLQKLIGPCSYNVTAWYFDEKYGVCSMFTYSGCGGNKNNFKTLEDCEKLCQPTNDVCDRPMDTEKCQSPRSFWIYDSANKTCRYIPTGYCEDKPHHFSSESTCQKQCIPQETPMENVCHFRMEEGPCRAYTRVWYYNMEEAICKPFIYGGCDGNKNRFDTKEKCESMCNKHSICNLKKDAGICYGYNEAYYFNSEKNQCQHFVYGGCEGNANRFTSMNQCRNICGGSVSNDTRPEPEKTGPGKCQLQPDSGNCKERNIFWYYDYKMGLCSRFYFTGCGGNDNKFATEKECLASCKSLLPMTTPYAPTINTSPTGDPKNRFTTIHVAPKQTLTLHCGELIDSTRGGTPVTWTHEGQDIVPDIRRQIKNLDLVVYDVTNRDAGMYSCREKSIIKKPTLDNFKVVIKVPVTIEYGPSQMRALLTRPLSIPCKTHGVPKPLITWYKDGKQLHNDNQFRILDNGTLTIDPFTSYDVATYKCLARNGYEGKAEKDVKVTIQDSLNLKIKKSSENNHVGDKITMTCMAEGYPSARLQWFYKDRELYSNRHITVRDGVLTINNATYDDSGIYTCRGIHGSDKVDKDESLRIKSRPDEVPKVCEDKLPVNRCRMIVAAKLCKRKTFHKNCCVSCSRSLTSRRR